MSINLLETVQKNLGYPLLHKIDPNTQDVFADEKTPAEDKFSQAAIPAVLTAMYNYVQSDEGAAAFLQNESNTNWIGKIFDDKTKEAVQTISSYALQSNADPVLKMNEIAEEAVKVVKENIGEHADIKEVKLFFSNQINTILLYLPAALHMGKLLQNDTLDDTTTKMEGPVSSLMKSIGSAFSTPVIDKEIKEQ